MKPPFNVPGGYTFFQEGHESTEDDRREEDRGKFKMSWFQEQVDTYISRRIVSNYEIYNYHPEGSMEKAKFESETKAANNDTCQGDNPPLSFPDDKKKDIVSKFLEKLFSFNMDKLIDGGSSNMNIDLRPCEVVTGVKEEDVSCSNVEQCKDKCSKSYYDACENSTEGSGDVVPLTALELFIKNAMDDSLAKFKEEINKAIDYKFESLRSLPKSSMSLEADCKLIASQLLPDSPLRSCLNSADLQEKIKSCIANEMPNMYDYSKDKECEIFNLIDPEVRNIFFGPESANFQSDSINVIKKNFSDPLLFKEIKEKMDDSGKFMEMLEGGDVPADLSKVINETSLVDDVAKTDEEKPDEESSNLNLEELWKRTGVDLDDSSENCIAEALKKCTNPKLMTDMTKFMYIIFESFRRLKEENLKRELESVSGSGSVNSCCESKVEDDTPAPPEEIKNVEEQYTDSGTKNDYKGEQAKEEVIVEVEKPEIVTENTSVKVISFPGEVARDERPIISQTDLGGVLEEANKTSCEKLDTLDQCAEVPKQVNEDTDSGYAVQKFKKNNIGYKPTPSSKMLENLKELYLQNLNSIERKKGGETADCGDKYECQIKKKFSPGEGRIGTRLDSKFYCNVSSKSPDKRKGGSEVSGRKGSSNIVSIRHSLMKRNRSSALKSIAKKKEISLDSTVISLLDISSKNKSSWLRKLSDLSSTSSEEEKNVEKVNLLKRLCLITFAWGKRQKHLGQMVDQHLSNIYNAICLDFVTDDVYKSVLFVSDHLRTGSQKDRDEIMRRWIKICNKPLEKEKRSFNLESLHQIWVQFRTKIWHLARPPPIVPPNFFPALTFPSEENRLIKEQVIQKYARDILEYISDPKLYKHTVSLYSCSSLNL